MGELAVFIIQAAVAAALPKWYLPEHEPRRVAGGIAIPAGSVLPGLRCDDAQVTVTVGHGSHIRGAIACAGSVTVASGCHIDGAVTSDATATVGARCNVGSVHGARVVVQPGAETGDIHSKGDVLLLGDCRVGHVTAGGDILIAGAPKAAGLEPQGRVVTRPW